jgi:hypothetical protein
LLALFESKRLNGQLVTTLAGGKRRKRKRYGVMSYATAFAN